MSYQTSKIRVNKKYFIHFCKSMRLLNQRNSIRYLPLFIIFETHPKHLQLMSNEITVKKNFMEHSAESSWIRPIYSQVVISRIVSWLRKKHILILFIGISGIVSSVWLWKPGLRPNCRMSWTVFQEKDGLRFHKFCRLNLFDTSAVSVIRICVIFQVN